ncbi:uncharacterized protein [Halyomorpha halys]|uniref:uncharacterized protein n=1 Tax=Halyomorpha halys TaxID=286706 RepID=UPI0006D4D88C|nr:uncharacterized protein LOC106685878 [Halyomorpha halys]
MNDTGLIEFIEVLRDHRCLWDPNDASYTNRTMRKEAQIALLNVFLKYDRNANLSFVRKKIDYIRGAYLRERKKVENSVIPGSMSNEIYVPTLWYYDHLNFLSEVYKVTKTGSFSPDPLRISFLEFDEEEKQEVHQQLGDDAAVFRIPPSKALKRKRINAQNQSVVKKIANTPETGRTDSWEAFGLSVGGDLRNLEAKQQTIAQKLISDVIFFSKMGQLSEDSAVAKSSIRLLSSSPSALSIMSPTLQPYIDDGPLSPSHDGPPTVSQPPVSDPSKYSLQKHRGAETKYSSSDQKISAINPSNMPTIQQQPEDAPLPQNLQ